MRILVQPASEPITLAEVRAQIGITDVTDTASDAIITRRITQARQWAELHTERSFLPQTLEMRFDHFSQKIELEAPPVSSVVAIKYIDQSGALQTVASVNYVLDNYPAVPFIRPAYGVSWPMPREEDNCVRVEYIAGYASDFPSLLKEAIMLIVGGWMNFQPQAESGIIATKIPSAAYQLLDKFRIYKL